MIWIFWIIVGIALITIGIFMYCADIRGEFVMSAGLATIFIFINPYMFFKAEELLNLELLEVHDNEFFI